ncbi:family 2A encapsulin nanocompartment cargo protein cysteine desulfurase [Paramagnetospirillum magneticum]|uniref:Cysteine desulfurase n=1 Tax=Paramagnetospirillum magneticum (strain ATCC 700264 / AMB-1) TaxID=342108 RepID=Q2W672_PARM1|nr:family 2A encapsulin nanocompartment cargo protein cysteine desulfurase [Paramagnetospirillum magneticum]BAE50653.1 Probable cysteine desulfurase 1 [Paramagnetospirillum magneticum AMB-1]
MTQPLSLELPSSPSPAALPAGDWEEPSAGFAGAPDARLIAQMANALFSAQPGQSAPSFGVAPPSLPLIEAAPTGGFVPPGVPAPPSVGNVTPVPQVPQVGPLAAAPAAPPGNPAAFPPTVLPGEPDLRGVLNQLGDVVRLVPPGHGIEPPAAAPEPPPGPSTESPPLLAIELRPDLVPDLRGTSSRVGVFDAHAVKRDFPILNQQVHGKPLIWLDNAATTQKPRQVIERLTRYYEHENSNIHRAAHALAARSTDAYEAAREKTRRFLNAGSTEEIVFVRGATEGINLIAKAWGERNVREGDEIVVTWLEHHANIVPWQQLAAKVGARLRVAPVDDSGQIILEEYEKLLGPRTRLVSLTQVSNALGTVTPAAEMTAMAHRHGALVLVDGAQAVSHMPVDVQALDCDFYVFSGHKVFAPTGIGAVFGKKAVLEHMPPWQGGGNMIADVTFEKTLFQPAPARFEAGTGNIADAVGLGAAIDYVEAIGMATIAAWEHQLLEYGTQGLLSIPGLRLVGTAKEKAGVLSFVIDGCRTEDIGKALDGEGIAVRSGHHCAQPILRRFGVESTVRPSLAFYNTYEDLDALVNALRRLPSARGI